MDMKICANCGKDYDAMKGAHTCSTEALCDKINALYDCGLVAEAESAEWELLESITDEESK